MEGIPPKPFGRGGRGISLKEAIDAAMRQPGVSSPSLSTSSSDANCSSSSSSGVSGVGSAPSVGRSLFMTQQLRLRKNLQPGSSSSSSSGSSAPQVAKGRAKQLTALKAMLTSSSKDSAIEDVSCSLSTNLEQLQISEKRQVVERRGTSGQQFSASCNWVKLEVEQGKQIIEYDVKFNPDVDAANVRHRLINSLSYELGGTKMFDGTKLWLPNKFPKKVTEFHAEHPVTKDVVSIFITLIKQVDMTQCLQFYNVIFNQVMRTLDMVRVRNSHYFPSLSVSVPKHKLEIWPGYVTAVSEVEGGLMLCCDTSHKVLRTQTVYQCISESVKHGSANYRDEVIKLCVGQIVLCRYNNKSYRIDDVDFQQNPMSTFNRRDGEITYYEYFKTQYGIEIRDKKQPLLINKVKKKDLKDQGSDVFLSLVPELCYLTGLTDEMRNDYHIMKDIAHTTKMTPTLRQAKLKSFINSVNSSSKASEILSRWGLTLMKEPLCFPGRALAPEKIIYGRKEDSAGENADWSRDACRSTVVAACHLEPKTWVLMFYSRDGPIASKFLSMLQQVCKVFGMEVGEPLMVPLKNERIESYVSTLKDIFTFDLKMAVIIFPTPKEDRYSAVKRLACCELGLPTQCIVTRTIMQDNRLRSVAQKIGLQMNCKLGGELWALKIPLASLMVCGIDVYHSAERKGQSVVGFVASFNQKITRWFSQVHFQNPGEELVTGLKACFQASLRHYYQVNHDLPKSIIIFRDGVSDGCLKLVQDYEIPQIAEIFAHFENYDPHLTFVIVQKRISTRIFTELNGVDYNNPPPGSIIDHSVTRREWYDFFLVSQFVRQGTVSPTHYIVLRDGENLDPDKVQRLTYKMTHMYYNWPGTIRVPAPCQYAHKVAYLIGQNVKKEPSPSLQNKLYYL